MPWIVLILVLVGFQTTAQTPPETLFTIPGVVFEPVNNQNLTLCIVNTQNKEPQWFLLNSTGNEHLGSISAALGFISDIKASSDGNYLAVLSIGEGHPMLEIIDLPKFLQTKSFHVLQKIDPYPGNISIESWNGTQLHIKSNMLLTHRDKATGRTSPDMALTWQETFALNMLTGEISGVSDGAKNPAEHYAQVLLDQNATESERDVALAKLLSLHSGELSLSDLVKILDQEQDPKRMNKLLDEIHRLRE